MRPICVAIFVAVASACLFGQTLPKTIRGYKVYAPATPIRLDTGGSSGPGMAITDFRFSSFSLNGLNLTAFGTVTNAGVSGTVEFIMFRDIKVNGLPVEIGEYHNALNISAHGTIPLGSPLELFIPIQTAARSAYSELLETRAKWSVVGTVLIFGRFRRFGFTFKRVVPVRIEIDIDNPLPRI